jgi:hypothetical protein
MKQAESLRYSNDVVTSRNRIVYRVFTVPFNRELVGLPMTLKEMVNAIERLQAVYLELRDEQDKAKQKIRWAINYLAEKIWSESL